MERAEALIAPRWWRESPGHPYWFPECFVCGMGNLAGVICMTPQVDEAHGGLVAIKGAMTGISEQVERDGHHWKR